MQKMNEAILLSVIVPIFNEEHNILKTLTALYYQYDKAGLINHDQYEVIIVDNNSSDHSVSVVEQFQQQYPDFNLHCIYEPVQGVSSARKRGMDWAVHRSRLRDKELQYRGKFYLFSADADCIVDRYWIDELYKKMVAKDADLGTCNYYYEQEHFLDRPLLWQQIEKILRCRAFTFTLFGGFPDGKGFAVERDKYVEVSGIEIFYQLHQGRFVQHLSDDWDFGIKILAYQGANIYADKSRVAINSRRIDHLLHKIIIGTAYGENGIIIMEDIRNNSGDDDHRDMTDEEAALAWDYAIKDFVPKNIFLPLLLQPNLYNNQQVADFFTPTLLNKIIARIEEIKSAAAIMNFKPIHLYKTTTYRLYFEFREEVFARLRAFVGDDIGQPPPLPPCLAEIWQRQPELFERYIYYFCEDRESGLAHNYFANGGVF